ncbi:MAG: hypothetical protein KC492_22575, partial [Myxococcales bacterium]|nr:hypothetical protein [Myxococcales bacterium]
GPMVGAAIDGGRAVVGGVDAGMRVRGKEERATGDGVTAMVKALDDRVSGLAAQVDLLRGFVVDQSLREIRERMAQSSRHLGAVGALRATFARPPSEAYAASVRIAAQGLIEHAVELERRPALCAQLIRARTPASAGGSELARGTAGRALFDLVRDAPADFSAVVAFDLKVELDALGQVASELTVPGAYFLRAPTYALSATKSSLEAASPGPERDGRHGLPLAPEAARPLLSVLSDVTELPYDRVEVRGRYGTRSVTRQEWEDAESNHAIVEALTRGSAAFRALP